MARLVIVHLIIAGGAGVTEYVSQCRTINPLRAKNTPRFGRGVANQFVDGKTKQLVAVHSCATMNSSLYRGEILDPSWPAY